MGIVVVPTYGSDPATITAANLDAKVAGLATEFNGEIDNDNIAIDAAIANSKLNLATITQNITHSGTLTHSGGITMSSKDITEAKGADVASATTTNIWVTDGNFIHITGTTTITSFGTAAQAGDERTIVFDGALTLTHNATSLILPGAANITTAAGDRAIVRAETTTNARVIMYQKASGAAVVSDAPSAATQAEMEAASSTSVYVTPGREHYHPGVAKATCLFNGTGTPAHVVRHNFDASITDNGLGDYTLSITTDFSSANFITAGSLSDTAGTRGAITVQARTAGTLRIWTHDATSSTANDFDGISIVLFGDQS